LKHFSNAGLLVRSIAAVKAVADKSAAVKSYGGRSSGQRLPLLVAMADNVRRSRQ